jgi:hypothetical protein
MTRESAHRAGDDWIVLNHEDVTGVAFTEDDFAEICKSVSVLARRLRRRRWCDAAIDYFVKFPRVWP